MRFSREEVQLKAFLQERGKEILETSMKTSLGGVRVGHIILDDSEVYQAQKQLQQWSEIMRIIRQSFRPSSMKEVQNIEQFYNDYCENNYLLFFQRMLLINDMAGSLGDMPESRHYYGPFVGVSRKTKIRHRILSSMLTFQSDEGNVETNFQKLPGEWRFEIALKATVEKHHYELQEATKQN